MTRAERTMELYAKLYVATRLRDVANLIGATLGTSYENTINWPGGTALGEMRSEFTALKRQMGGSDRRQFERLLAEWMSPVSICGE